MKQTIFPKSRATRLLYKLVPTNDGNGHKSEPDGTEEFYYETIIDLDALTAMAHQAARNRSGRSRDGALIVRIIERNRLTQ